MAVAKKCDRCGKFYEHYPTGNKMEYNAIRRLCTAANNYINREEVSIDLCPKCMEEFDKFMIGDKFDAT